MILPLGQERHDTMKQNHDIEHHRVRLYEYSANKPTKLCFVGVSNTTIKIDKKSPQFNVMGKKIPFA